MSGFTPTIYDTDTLLGVFNNFDDQKPTTYFLDLCFTSEANFDTEFVDFEKISDVLKIAPFVMPMAHGKPIYSEGSTVTRVRAGYIKMNDAVSPSRIIKRRPGTLAGMGAIPPGSPQGRYDAIIADIMRQHNNACWRTWEWMASQAVLTGSVTLSSPDAPPRVVNFGRDAGNTVTLSGGAVWGGGGNILNNIETWRQLVRVALFGGPTNRLTVGSGAWELMRNDTGIQNLLRYGLDKYAGGLDPNLGIRKGDLIEYVGQVSAGLPVVVHSDYYQDPVDGHHVSYIGTNDVILTGPNVNGFRCYGAILDPHAQFRPLSIFPRMFVENDPALTFVMTQSSPLMVPINPNNTFKATVA